MYEANSIKIRPKKTPAERFTSAPSAPNIHMNKPQSKKKAKFDPSLIIFRIILVQFTFYSSLIILIWVFDWIFYIPRDFSQIIGSKSFGNISIMYLSSTIPYFLTNIGLAFIVAILVNNKAQCLDYIGTCYIIHLFVVSIINWSPPTTFTWYFLNLLIMVISVLISEYLFIRTSNTKLKNHVQIIIAQRQQRNQIFHLV